MKKCTIIMNPQSGKRKKLNTYEDLYDILRKYGYDTEIILTKGKDDAEGIIQSLPDDTDLVISAGGDGTLNEIVSGNLKRIKKLTIAPLPLGSTNDVGHMYGLTYSVLENLEKVLSGTRKKIDICHINDKTFVYVACLGDYIDMVYSTPRKLKEKFGRAAYFLYGIKKFKTKLHSYNIKYTVNNEEHEGEYSFIFITNASRVAGQPDVYYDIKLDDNMFEVALANVKNMKELSKLFVLVTTMDVKDIPGVTYYRTNHFELEFMDHPETSWCIDGEEYKTDTNKFVFDVEQSMYMLVPKENSKKLFEK